jgi:plasmid maintenance system antidote protein VapI
MVERRTVTAAGAAQMTPAEAFPVMDFVCEELQERGWTLDDLASRMGGEFGVNRLALDMLLAFGDHRNDTFERGVILGDTMAAGFANAFGISAEFFSNLDAQYRAWLVAHDLGPRHAHRH